MNKYIYFTFPSFIHFIFNMINSKSFNIYSLYIMCYEV